jgi:hypothetical protein
MTQRRSAPTAAGLIAVVAALHCDPDGSSDDGDHDDQAREQRQDGDSAGDDRHSRILGGGAAPHGRGERLHLDWFHEVVTRVQVFSKRARTRIRGTGDNDRSRTL